MEDWLDPRGQSLPVENAAFSLFSEESVFTTAARSGGSQEARELESWSGAEGGKGVQDPPLIGELLSWK